MLTAESQSKPPELAVSFPHTQVEEIQNISLVVLESDLFHDFLQAVHGNNNFINYTEFKEKIQINEKDVSKGIFF